MVAIDIQLTSSHVDWPTLRRASLEVEARGFDALWVMDHLAGSPMGGTSSLECFTWLGALAEATSRIHLGVLVANTWNRRLGTLAVAAASVAEISGRPFLLGIGAGAAPDTRWAGEHHAVGADLHDDPVVRHRRVEQLLDLTDEMWHPDRGTHLATFPLPRPTPPRIVGANSTGLAELAGRRADGVNVAWGHPRRADFLLAARRAAGDRPFITTAWATWSPDLLDPAHPTRMAMEHSELDRIILSANGEHGDFL